MLEQMQFDLIRNWVLAATELPEVILSHQQAPRPQNEGLDIDYGVLNLVQSNRIGLEIDDYYFDNPAYTGPDDLENAPEWQIVIQEHEFIWSFNIYAKNAMNVALRLTPWAKTQPGREILGALNLFSMSSPIRLPELINQVYHDRVTMNLSVRTYVCEMTQDYDGQTILLGRVPSDIVEQVTFNIDNGRTSDESTVIKP